MDFVTILERFGLPIAGLAIFMAAFYKLFWPQMIKMIDENRLALLKQVDEADRRAERQSDEFLKALERRDQLLSNAIALYGRMDRAKTKKPGPNGRRTK